jgi:fumarate hydratase class II
MAKRRTWHGTGQRFRIEHDSMGELRVPADALWGAQTQRAVQNFPISGRPMPRGFIRALGLVKAAAAEVNAGSACCRSAGAAIRKAALAVADRRPRRALSRSTSSRPARAPRAT